MESASKISADEINPVLTQAAREDPRYKVFLDWCSKNGAIFKDVDFPVAFGPNGVIGMAAKTNIPLNTSFMAIPSKMLITLDKAKESELCQIFKENPEIFDDDSDWEFNILSTYLLFEKLKGKHSFFQPYFNAITHSVTTLNWSEEELAQTEDPYIIKEAKEYKEDMHKLWERIKPILNKNELYFPVSRTTKEEFFWCYELVMTRCFGWGIPCTMMIPLGDFLNHSCDGANHYMVNLQHEVNDKKKPGTYVVKKTKVDLKIFEKKELVTKRVYPASKAQARLEYIESNIDKISSQSVKKLKSGEYTKDELKKMVREIHGTMMKKEEYRHIWNFLWYDSSDDEDNDTSDSESEEEEEEEEDKQSEPSTKATSTTEKSVENKGPAEKKIAFQTTTIKNQTTTTVKKPTTPATTVKPTTTKLTTDKKPTSTTDKKTTTTVGTANKKPTTTTIGTDKNKVEKPVEQAQKVVQDEKDEETESDEEDFEWYEDDNPDTYFVFTTDNSLSYKKGEQVFNCYGRRTNRFLLVWYGFCFPENKFNSMSFSYWADTESNTKVFAPKRMMYRSYVTLDEWDKEKVNDDPKDRNPNNLSAEFRLKPTWLCEELMCYIRSHLSRATKGIDGPRFRDGNPSKSPNYEECVVEYMLQTMLDLKSFYTTTLEEDLKALEDEKMDYKKRFCLVYRSEQKKIIEININALKVLMNFFAKLESGASFRNAYMEKVPEIDRDDDQFILHRKLVANYLRQFHKVYLASIEPDLVKL